MEFFTTPIEKMLQVLDSSASGPQHRQIELETLCGYLVREAKKKMEWECQYFIKYIPRLKKNAS